MIEQQMPETAALLSHRMMDVSGYREQIRHYVPEVASDLTPEVAETLEGLGSDATSIKHRALYDAVQTLAEARAQRAALRRLVGYRE